MASILAVKIQQLESAHASLVEVLGKEKNTIVRDAGIQRFEYTTEIFWKTLKVYLLEKAGIDVASPKMVMREARNASIFSDQDVTLALHMIDDRNQSTHLYNEAMAQQIFEKIPEYMEFVGRIVVELKRK